ncbi:MAG: hypothetical protein ACJATA_001180 [Sphingobacteriales bacterium]|jgi:hypothetical protein
MEIIKEIFTKTHHVVLTDDEIVITKRNSVFKGEESLEEAMENWKHLQNFVEGKTYPMIHHLSQQGYSLEARKFYSTVPALASCAALVSTTFIQKLLGNFFLNFKNNKLPMKLFSDEQSAIKWAKTFKND